MSNISLISAGSSVAQRLYYPGVYPKIVSFDTIRLFEKSPMYRVALDLHLKYGMMVGDIKKDLHNDLHVVEMVRADGFGEVVLRRRVNDKTNVEEIELLVYDSPAGNGSSKLCGSAKPKYVLNKYDEFRKNDTPCTTDEVIRDALFNLDSRIKDTSEADRYKGKYPWGTGLSNYDELAQEIIEYATGKRTTVSQAAISKATEISNKAKERADGYAKHRAELFELFGGPKFVIATPSEEYSIYRFKRRHGLIFGVIQVTSFSPYAATQLEPMRWYHSLHDLPEQYKDGVLAKLTFAKLSREDNEEGKRDPDGYLPPASHCVWNKPLNMANWAGSYSSSAYQWIMFPKS